MIFILSNIDTKFIFFLQAKHKNFFKFFVIYLKLFKSMLKLIFYFYCFLDFDYVMEKNILNYNLFNSDYFMREKIDLFRRGSLSENLHHYFFFS